MEGEANQGNYGGVMAMIGEFAVTMKNIVTVQILAQLTRVTMKNIVTAVI